MPMVVPHGMSVFPGPIVPPTHGRPPLPTMPWVPSGAWVPPTWPADVDIHAVRVELALGRRQGHGGRHADVGGDQVVLGPLPAVHGVLGLCAHLLHLPGHPVTWVLGPPTMMVLDPQP